MKTLIIHPKDRTTSFLDIVYKDMVNKTVITGQKSKTEVRKLMMEHDRIIMMGHGSPSGLFSVGQFSNCSGIIIDDSMVDILSTKENNIFIWCNADKFVQNHKLGGFYSGMFISEVGEAIYCGLKEISQKMVDESNYGFCEILSKYVDKSSEIIHENVLREYGHIAHKNPVATYNHERLYKS